MIFPWKYPKILFYSTLYSKYSLIPSVNRFAYNCNLGLSTPYLVGGEGTMKTTRVYIEK